MKDEKFKLYSNEGEQSLFEKNSKDLNADEKYRLWMNLRYNDFKQLILEYLNNENEIPNKIKSTNIKLVCLNSLFDLIKYETIHKKTGKYILFRSLLNNKINFLFCLKLKTSIKYLKN